MQTVRQQELALAPGIVAYLKMLVTLGALRHQLAPDYDLPLHARRFFERLLRQQGADWLDPRQALDRLYDGGLRVRRTLDFVELIEAQAPLITAAGGAYFGVRRRLETVRRRVVRLGVAALMVGAGLYFLLSRPDSRPRRAAGPGPHRLGARRPPGPPGAADPGPGAAGARAQPGRVSPAERPGPGPPATALRSSAVRRQLLTMELRRRGRHSTGSTRIGGGASSRLRERGCWLPIREWP